MKFLSLTFLLAFVLIMVLSGCDNNDNGTSDGGTEVVPPPSEVTLSALSDFSCSSSWTTRDGALGLKAHSGSGSCQASFPGESGDYMIVLTIQTEFDGQPKYSVALGGHLIKSDRYPLSSTECGCEEENWRDVCPDRKRTVDLGKHTVAKGDEVKFYGEEDWDCEEHGAYCKWHEITFQPVQ